jgi:hypothetical protein
MERPIDLNDIEHQEWRQKIAALVAQELATVDLTDSEKIDLSERIAERIAS